MLRSPLARIVILGGGFAGISAARELARISKRQGVANVHLVNSENYFVFQPLLPEVAACSIEPNHILNPIRHLCPTVHVHCATVHRVDLDKREITLMGSAERDRYTLHYDHLVFSLGLRMNLSRIPGMPEHSLPLKTLGDAFHLRNHVLRCLEEAELTTDETRRRMLLTLIVIGGGFSGIETIGALHDMIKSVLRWYPRTRAAGYRAILVHAGDRVLQELAPELSSFTEKTLQRRGIEIRLNSSVTEATPDSVLLSTGESLNAGTVVCTVGNSPHELLETLGLPQERGRLLVNPDLRVRGHDQLWAIGDNALVPDVTRGGFCPSTAQYATRQGVRCARNLVAMLQNRVPQPFTFGGLGQLASVGHHTGVGRLLGMNISGIAAWLLWRSVYLAKVPGLRSKMQIGLDWLLELLFPRNITMMDLERTTQLKRAHFRPGDVIFRQGDIGDHFYIIQAGEVEILRSENGSSAVRIATRSAGDSFGELALLKATSRTATVRCMTSVDVIMLTRKDFSTLVGSSRSFRTQMDQETASLTHL